MEEEEGKRDGRRKAPPPSHPPTQPQALTMTLALGGRVEWAFVFNKNCACSTNIVCCKKNIVSTKTNELNGTDQNVAFATIESLAPITTSLDQIRTRTGTYRRRHMSRYWFGGFWLPPAAMKNQHQIAVPVSVRQSATCTKSKPAE
jgi:hypothetical protein